ncbi:MAG: lysyl-tRNA synthetase, class II [Parcubacteria group bacterium Gr01-1014_31]|nr:MAG: lysyl-tRNA synthetase, class II [Parcubacteria group bacterium Gr01-1014_31]
MDKKKSALPDEGTVRRKKATMAMAAGRMPYPQVFERPLRVVEARKKPPGTTGVTVGGRLMRIRTIGQLTFADVHDGSGRIQLQAQRSMAAEGYQAFLDLLDPGDFISVFGDLMTTKTGELTVAVQRWQLLAKALRPLPDKFHGLKDHELRYRKRYLDLLVNPEVRTLFQQRSRFITAFRRFLDSRGFLEVETPVLELIPGGAEAEPFVTHHRTLDIDLYLRISLELHLKRLLVGGLDRIYEIGKVFRNEGMSNEHLQEFTMLEFYQAYADYEDLQQFVQECYREVLQETFGMQQFEFQGKLLDFRKPWAAVDYTDGVRAACKVDVVKATDDELRRALARRKIAHEPSAGRGRLIDLLYKKTLRPSLLQPTLVINHPVAVSPLAKRHRDNPELTERITVVVAGSEVGNGFSELNDPLDQRQRFEQQVKLRAAGDAEAQMMDEDFVEALEHGMPPAAGFGVGIDRLFMLVTGQPSVRDVVLFPTMRPDAPKKI